VHVATHSHPHNLIGSRLRRAFLLTIVVLVVEVFAGYVANSLALVSDAGHIFTDAFSLGLAWFATRLSARPPDERNTFGYHRSGILAALVNASVLLLITGAIAVEAIIRLQHPEHVAGGVVIGAALVALAVNSYIAIELRADGVVNLNVRAALLHVVGDIVASGGVVLVGLAILLWHLNALDPVLSLAIAVLIAYGAWQIVRDGTSILMESAPAGLDPDEIRAAMLEVPGAEDIHDLHVWALADGYHLLSAHVSVPDQSLSDSANLLANLKLLLRRRFHIDHATIELECVDCTLPLHRPIRFESAAAEHDQVLHE
jgi:cobalt-zinc-cadmium efflux system protein